MPNSVEVDAMHYAIFYSDNVRDFQKLGLEEMFEVDFTKMCA